MRRETRFLLIGLLLGSCAGDIDQTGEDSTPLPVGAAVTQSFQDGVSPTASYTGTRDTQLSQASPSTNYGTTSLLRVDGDDPSGSTFDKSVLLKWDLSAIPVGSAIQSATLTLNVHETSGQSFSLGSLLRDWSEAQANWTQFASGAPWQVAGGGGAQDRGSAVIGTAAMAASGPRAIVLNSSGIALVQQWVNTPSSNFGLLIANNTNWDGFTFDSRESGTAAARPKLTVSYAPPSSGTGGTGGTGGSGGASGGGGGAGLSLYDDFNGPLYTITSDGVLTPNGLWRIGFVSQGFAKTVQDPSNASNHFLETSPKLDVLRSARVDTTRTWKGIHGRLRARLDAQLQPPISWYTLWPLIAFVNDTTHYYFNLKTNGWELGKKDNDHPASEEIQEFLNQGSTPRAVIGQWYTIEWWVVPDSASNNIRIRVDVDGAKVVDMLDNQPWQRNGTTGSGASAFFMTADKKVTLYNEGSQVSWDDVFITEATTIP